MATDPIGTVDLWQKCPNLNLRAPIRVRAAAAPRGARRELLAEAGRGRLTTFGRFGRCVNTNSTTNQPAIESSRNTAQFLVDYLRVAHTSSAVWV
ncbi:MAG: hypothetical protein EB142_06470 [Actinobacteria bacterium]|nr:hypothetical protein [Actinomycetota bacterium]